MAKEKKNQPEEKRPTTVRRDSQRLNRTFFLVLLAGAALLVFFVARVFLLPVLLAAIAAALFHPLNRRILRRVGNRSTLAAFISLLIFCLIILIPIALLGYLVTQNVIEVTRLVNRNIPQIRIWLQSAESWIANLPFVEGRRISSLIDSTRLVAIIQQTGSTLVEGATSFAGNVARVLFLLFVFIYSLFFLIRDGDKALLSISEAIPLPKEDKLAITDKFVSVSRATLKSTFLIGGIQGVIGTILFLALGIPGAVLFGALFLVLAAIPGLGPAVIWLPTTLILFALDRYFQAALMLVIGGGLIPLVDYVLRPRLVGQDTQLHPLLVLIGVLGGVSLFGIWGLLFGPLAMSVAVTLVSIFKRIFKGELREI
ncbi:MAG: AI-2E family transporter [Spirochaetaceae bacterium]|nr:MAG: AI-2E family transporter [Spirochaetaceae bacterium]